MGLAYSSTSDAKAYPNIFKVVSVRDTFMRKFIDFRPFFRILVWGGEPDRFTSVFYLSSIFSLQNTLTEQLIHKPVRSIL